ncbi:unnamed protein product [Schistocephalus solidus]|uniref:Reverse transcriptase domain-containing protein n=1 Tax=Schistocephalus solidus TaxID=70667 RepID=A0A183SS02_SCHSO|nr:unnamed protein product [Schistocephalus solidus]
MPAFEATISTTGHCLEIYSTNCQSLFNKFDELRSLASEQKPHIIALTKTWPTGDIGLSEVVNAPVAARATVTTGGLNQVRVSGAVCASTPSISDSRTSHLHPLKHSKGGGESNPAIYGPRFKGTAPLLSYDGTTLLTEKSQILKRWAEHFRSSLNCSLAISDAAIDRLPQAETKNDLDLLPSLPETIRVVQQMSSGKAPGSDAIPLEVFQHGGPQLMAELTTLFQGMWRQVQVPQDFKDATIVHLYKREGNRQLCDNHRGISLLNIAGKIFARIFLTRLNGHLEQVLLPESQCGFRRHRGTTDMIFAAH